MVAVIHKRAHSVVDNLSYNLKKIDSSEAEIVKIENLPDGAEYNPAIISGYMRWWERRSQRMTKTAFHMSVNPSDDDNANLPKETILEYINGLMTHLGYANQPYIVVEHNDIERRHFHVVSVRVDENGKGIPTHKDGHRVKEYSIANQERFGFVYGKDPLAEDKNLNIHSRFEKGRGRIKEQIRIFASGILKSYSFSTQSQFSKIMRHYGIKAEWKRKEDTSILLCQGLDSQGNAVTRPVTLPQLQTESIMVACSKRPEDYEEKRKAALHRLKDAYYESTSVEELQNCLEENNVELLFDKTKDGTKIYGVTLIDYHTRSVFKGSELDKTLMNDIKAGIFKERPREVKPYDPFEETKQIINEFNSMAGESAIWNPKVFGLRLEGNKVSLTYEGKDYIWMELNKPNISMNRNTPQWIMELIDKCNNVFDIAKVFGPIVLSESNITRAKNPQPAESEIQEQPLQKSKGPRMH